jgi:hypothetical protein
MLMGRISECCDSRTCRILFDPLASECFRKGFGIASYTSSVVNPSWRGPGAPPRVVQLNLFHRNSLSCGLYRLCRNPPLRRMAAPLCGSVTKGILPEVEITTKRLLIALLAVNATGGVVAMKHRVAGEPFGIGASLDVRNPAVVVLWGTALSAPITSLGLATALYRRRPEALWMLAAMFAIGALSEPAFWGRRPCPRFGRVLLMAHVVIAIALAIRPAGTDPPEDHIS